MSTLFVVAGFGGSWHPLIVLAAAGMFLPMTILMAKLLALKSPNPYIIYILMFNAFIFSLLTTEYPATGFVFDAIAFSVIIYALNKLGVVEKLQNPERKSIFMLYWLIFTLSASISSSVGLAELKYMENLAPIILIGTIFGWLGPEVTYRIIGGVYGAVKALALTFVFLMIFVLLYGLIFGDIFPTMNYLVPDGPKVFLISFTALPSMLLSRITMEFFKTYGGLDF